mmetsp:Transcript_100872/g.284573  ORF Transcript_100872/g.284573 Transcript_100872/m.284573 type:complete len:206 (-) Transcript_100872:319-936(-)
MRTISRHQARKSGSALAPEVPSSSSMARRRREARPATASSQQPTPRRRTMSCQAAGSDRGSEWLPPARAEPAGRWLGHRGLPNPLLARRRPPASTEVADGIDSSSLRRLGAQGLHSACSPRTLSARRPCGHPLYDGGYRQRRCHKHRPAQGRNAAPARVAPRGYTLYPSSPRPGRASRAKARSVSPLDRRQPGEVSRAADTKPQA